MLRVGYSPCCDPATRDPSPRCHDSRGWLVLCALRAGCSPCCDPATRDLLVPESHVVLSAGHARYKALCPYVPHVMSEGCTSRPSTPKKDLPCASLDQGSGYPRELLPIPLGGRDDSGIRNGTRSKQER